MNIPDFLKNPLVLGIIGSILTYGYLHYTSIPVNPADESSVPSVSLAKPLIVGVLTWFISSIFLEQVGSGSGKKVVSKPSKLTESEGKLVSTADSALTSEQVEKMVSNLSNEMNPKVVPNKPSKLMGGNKGNTKMFTDVANF